MPEGRGAILAAVIVLAACSPDDGTSSSPEARATAAGETAAETQGGPGTTLPGSERAFRYVGRWAESVEQCRSEAWTLTRDRLTAPEDISCDFTRVDKSPGGYAIDAMCTFEGEEEEDNLVLRFAESAKAMLVEGAASLPETGLVYCGEAPRGPA